MDETLWTPYVAQAAGNFVAAPILIGIAGLIPEPWRQRSMAGVLLLAALTYRGGGLGAAEYLFAGVIGGLALVGFRWYPALGLAWLAHALSDVAHHVTGHPMVASMPLSSFGCLVLDPLLAVWFLFGAPSTRAVVKRLLHPTSGRALEAG